MRAPAERTDEQVVRDVLAGDRDAFRLLVRRYGDALYSHALRMAGDPDVAADLAQEAFVTGYRRLARLRDPEKVGAWLFRIVANSARDHLRARREGHVSLDALPELAGQGRAPDAAAAESELRSRLGHALDGLTPEQREVFVLKHMEGRSYEEIAAVMELSVGALKMRVSRAREALRGLLEEFA
jgi:RNA polymerase sigma-70 factor (ECF subfamily)